MTDRQILDLSRPTPGHNLDVSITPIESDGDRKARIAKDLVVFGLAVIACGVILAYAFYTAALDSAATEPTKRWAFSILSGGAGGLLGYLLKK